jgi:hypothetical protein
VTDGRQSFAQNLMIILSQLSGFVMLFFGVSVYLRHWIEPARPIGIAICVLAAFQLLVLPLYLIRRGRTTAR